MTILTMMPARLQVATAAGTSGRTGSLMPSTATAVRPRSTLSNLLKKSAGRPGSDSGRSA